LAKSGLRLVLGLKIDSPITPLLIVC
jgi:hypothetical protein